MKNFKVTFSCILLATLLFSDPAVSKENFLNLGAVPAKADEHLMAEMDKPFNEFIKVWMKDNRLAAFNRIIRGDIGTFEKHRKFYARTETEFDKMVTNTVSTFKAYCEHHQGEIELLKSDIFCLKQQQPIAWMVWKYADNYAHFTLDGSRVAKEAYMAKVTDIEPGNTIETSYGNALVLEKGQNGLVKVQLTRGGERWISTDNIVVRPR